MKKAPKKVQISFYIPDDVNKLYQNKYPNTLSTLLRHCVYASLNSREVFEKIFFDVREHILEEK